MSSSRVVVCISAMIIHFFISFSAVQTISRVMIIHISTSSSTGWYITSSQRGQLLKLLDACLYSRCLFILYTLNYWMLVYTQYFKLLLVLLNLNLAFLIISPGPLCISASFSTEWATLGK